MNMNWRLCYLSIPICRYIKEFIRLWIWYELKKFDLLDKKGSGVIDFDDAIEDLEQEQQERILDLERQLEAIDEQDDVAHFFQRFTSPTKTSDNSNAHIESGLEMTEADAYPSLEDDSDSDDDENDLYVISNPMRNI